MARHKFGRRMYNNVARVNHVVTKKPALKFPGAGGAGHPSSESVSEPHQLQEVLDSHTGNDKKGAGQASPDRGEYDLGQGGQGDQGSP